MPGIKNFRERKILRDIYEQRDNETLTTYTYLWNEFNGKKVFFCNSVGYGIPYSTQFSNPMKIITFGEHYYAGQNPSTSPQAEPNGLFTPGSAEGTWIQCKDPHGKEVKPVYVEPRVIVSPFPLDN